MADHKTRSFEIKPAARKAVPLNIGMWGPSGCGKTFSALRLATGIQKIYGGRIIMADTENGRGNH